MGINVDHLDGRSGLLVRRVDPEGLVHQHNLQVWGSQRMGGWVGLGWDERKEGYVYIIYNIFMGLCEYKYMSIKMKE